MIMVDMLIWTLGILIETCNAVKSAVVPAPENNLPLHVFILM